MTDNFIISIYHDTRRPKKNGLFPVKLRVFSTQAVKTKFYPTVLDLSPAEFKKSWGETAPRGEYRDVRLKLLAIENHANDVARGLKTFSFDNFERKIHIGRGAADDVFSYYDSAIDGYKENGQIGTGDSYRLSKRSLVNFLAHQRAKNVSKLKFFEITPDWLSKYEKFMLSQGKALTTVGIYLRPLRAIFNSAMRDKVVDMEGYPFGRKKYIIPGGRNVKKALNQADLKKLFNANPGTVEQEKARDFWFLSYSCNGANIKDILGLRWKNIDSKMITFYRAKTKNTAKSDLRPISVYKTEFAEGIIKKYGSELAGPDDFVFPVFTKKMTEEQKHRAIKNFIKFINQNLKKLAIKETITGDISTYFARHSYATNAVRNGASMEFVQEALGHVDTKTTVAYFKGFEDRDKEELMNKLMDFSL